MASPSAPDFGRILARLASGLDGQGLPYMVIGGQAVLVHGEPRLTRDVDITLGIGPDRLDSVMKVCDAVGLDALVDDPRAFAARTFVLPVIVPESAVRVDFIFSTTPYEREAIQRAVRIELGGATVAFAGAEDLVLHKLFAGRPRDLEDVRGIIARKGDTLDWALIEGWARAFAAVPGRETMPEQVQALRDEADPPS